MQCPACSSKDLRVLDSRPYMELNQIKRRRQCSVCEYRFRTAEIVEVGMPKIIKRSGALADFNSDKVRSGIMRAVEKRPLTLSQFEGLMDRIVQKINNNENVITPFAEQKDWAMLAEWNANSIIGCFQRHLDQCIASSDKTRDLMKNAMREDVGTEITMLNVDKLIFRRDAQDLNIKRAEMIVNELLLTYEVAFGKKFMPRAKSSGKDVTKQAQMKEYNLARLKEAMQK